jgi:choline dehydrogenase-like flavoprotein
MLTAETSSVVTRDDIAGDTLLACDVVIVGSGAGGATCAAELAEHGLDVIVLEEGRYHTTRDFTADSSEMIRALYRDGGATVAIGSPPILYQEGIAVGGSTVINGGMSWRTPERILDRWRIEDGIDRIGAADMAYYFDRVERRIHVARQDPESIGEDNAILRRGAQAMGWKVVDNLRNQVHCAGSNNCAWGCPTGAKQSALVSYVPRALHFGARVVSDVRAESITRSGKRATGVVGHVVRENGSRGPRVEVRARLVISACGAIHTPALLWRSGFRSPSGLLGKRMSMHPNVKVVALFDQPVRGWEGVHQAYQVREFQDEGLVFCAVNVPPSVLALSFSCYGPELGELMAQYDRMLVAGMLCEDTATGEVKRLPGGRPQAFYQMNEFDADKLRRGTALLCELLFEAGARRIVLPFVGARDLQRPEDARRLFADSISKERMEVFTVHMMGTARMGADRAGAVTDSYGNVHDTDRLMICDASLFPSPIGVNPMETIQALATRNVHHVLDNRARYLT